MMVPFESVLRSEEESWKRVVEPVLEMEKRVDDAPEFEVEPIAKRRLLAMLVVEAAWTERSAEGEVEPTLTLLAKYAPPVVVALVVVALRAIRSVRVVEPNTANPPREKIPLTPTESPPPIYASAPIFILSETFMVFVSIVPIEALGNFAPFISTILSVMPVVPTYAYLPETKMPRGVPPSESVPTKLMREGVETSITPIEPLERVTYA